MGIKKGGSAHDRAVARASQQRESPESPLKPSETLIASSKHPRITEDESRSLFSKWWVQIIVFPAIFLAISLPLNELYTRWRTPKISPIVVSPSEIKYGLPAPGAVNTFSDSYNFKISNTTDQDIYGVVVKLYADSSAASVYDFASTIEQDGLKPIDPDDPKTRGIGDVLDRACFDSAKRAIFFVYVPHLESKGHRELNLTYRTAGYDETAISPGTKTMTLPDSSLGFLVRSQVVNYSTKPTPIHKSANGDFFPLGVEPELTCATPRPTRLVTGASDSPTPVPSEDEVKAANVLGVKLVKEYDSKHCPANPEKAVAWINEQLRKQNARFQISGVSPDSRVCNAIPGINFQNVRGLTIEGVTVSDPAGPGISVKGSPGSSINNNTVVYGNHNQIHTSPPTPATQPAPQ